MNKPVNNTVQAGQLCNHVQAGQLCNHVQVGQLCNHVQTCQQAKTNCAFLRVCSELAYTSELVRDWPEIDLNESEIAWSK